MDNYNSCQHQITWRIFFAASGSAEIVTRYSRYPQYHTRAPRPTVTDRMESHTMRLLRYLINRIQRKERIQAP